jgi:toxin YoeB
LAKKKPSEPQKNLAEVVRVAPVFSPQFREDLYWWGKTDQRLWEKVWDLVEAVMLDPFVGLGKPEPLKHIGSNLWSRRINLEHRLVYQVEQKQIIFLQARFHYE